MNKKMIDRLVELDKERKANSRRINNLKAEIQKEALSTMEERNIKFIRYRGAHGSVVVQDTMALDILNPMKLREALPEGVFNNMVSMEMKPSYKADTNLEKALKAVYNQDYILDMTLEDLFDQMNPSPDAGQRKLLSRKLKGAYEKDLETLRSIFPDAEHDWDVELWHIYRIKNTELIKKLLGEKNLEETIEKVKKCIIVDSKTALKLEYEEED